MCGQLHAVSSGGRGMMEVFFKDGTVGMLLPFFCWAPTLLRLKSVEVLCLLLGC